MGFEKAYKLDEVLDGGFITESALDKMNSSGKFFALYFLQKTDTEVEHDSPVMGASRERARYSVLSGPFEKRPELHNEDGIDRNHKENVRLLFMPEDEMPERFERASRLQARFGIDELFGGYFDRTRLQKELQALAEKLVSLSSTPDIKPVPYQRYELSISGKKVRFEYADLSRHPLSIENAFTAEITKKGEETFGAAENIITDNLFTKMVLASIRGPLNKFSLSGLRYTGITIQDGITYTPKGKETVYLF